jgi:hypothetical protein
LRKKLVYTTNKIWIEKILNKEIRFWNLKWKFSFLKFEKMPYHQREMKKRIYRLCHQENFELKSFEKNQFWKSKMHCMSINF